MSNNSPKVIMITGAAGYVGAMLCHQFSKSPDLKKIIAVDMQTIPAILKDNKKIIWITANLADSIWKIPALINKPEVVIHCAWQIKELYGKRELQDRLNTESTRAVFEFCFKNSFVKKIIHFSTISSYGAYSDNSLDRPFSEADELRESEALYGLQKKIVEEDLKKLYEDSDKSKQVVILRPSSVTGPRGRSMESKKVGLLNILKNVLPFIPVGSGKWCRQYVHEDDITDAVGMFTFGGEKFGTGYEVFILSPNDYILAIDMAKLFGKSVIWIPPFLIRFAFFLAWHLSSGKVPTSKGGWRFFCYPVPVDGSLITKKYGFEYSYTSHEALEKEEGRYAESIV
ncbi:MAG: NAD-dependent epimerase/dehydratase family protein [bacterium]|nr:NAD-dependent epimerase/dehydratase family protein [bacterium]